MYEPAVGIADVVEAGVTGVMWTGVAGPRPPHRRTCPTSLPPTRHLTAARALSVFQQAMGYIYIYIYVCTQACNMKGVSVWRQKAEREEQVRHNEVATT